MQFLNNENKLKMPIYTYRCDNCGVQFERQQKFSDLQLSRCPECSKKALRKVFTPVGIVFKGSGFYSTDNRSPSGSKRTPDTNQDEGDTKPDKPESTEQKSENSKDTKKESQETKLTPT